MPGEMITSWGRIQRVEQEVVTLASRFDALPGYQNGSISMLPYGNGRSYGDSCLNSGGMALKTRALDRFIFLDSGRGVLRCEAGILLSEILSLIVPLGWYLPVTPGTRFITVGGAIANDVHGKNHHVAGTFGCHISRFELLRSDGSRLICSAAENPDYFAATIGGLGLTGLVTWAEIQLLRISNPWIDSETIRYESLDEFFQLCAESDQDFSYTVSWVDCAFKGTRLGRGLFTRGNHAPEGTAFAEYSSRVHTFPFSPPVSLINSLTLKSFNTAYYHKQQQKKKRTLQHYEPFFYPLDGILEWNRIYGPKGFYQYQCVVPMASGQEAIAEMLYEIAQSGQGSFLTVLKICGSIQSLGMLSFPLPGVSLALDFPNKGTSLQQLFARLDSIVSSAGGRLYPAKDARMPGAIFRSGFPCWEAFTKYIDPAFSSSFWRRVMERA